jgi:hypothetical protein
MVNFKVWIVITFFKCIRFTLSAVLLAEKLGAKTFVKLVTEGELADSLSGPGRYDNKTADKVNHQIIGPRQICLSRIFLRIKSGKKIFTFN